MKPIKLKRFIDPGFLHGIGRDSLRQFFARFQTGLSANGLTLPPPTLSLADYFSHLAVFCANLEKFPPELNDALIAIEELSTHDGVNACQVSARWPRFQHVLREDSSPGDIIMQLYLLDAQFIHDTLNRQRLRRLTKFEYAAAPVPCAPGQVRDPHDRQTIMNLTANLDHWFARHSRGSDTAAVDIYELNGETWFTVRHGDVFSRVRKVNRRERETLNFRPEKDDVVVLSHNRREIRVNAHSDAERDLYFREFGLHLFGSENYFACRNTVTLDPLRRLGDDALNPRGIRKIAEINLNLLEVFDPSLEDTFIHSNPRGLFRMAAAYPSRPHPVPTDGLLSRAVFEIQFIGAAKSFAVEVRTPNFVKFSRACDSRDIEAWLRQSQFLNTPALNPDTHATLSA